MGHAGRDRRDELRELAKRQRLDRPSLFETSPADGPGRARAGPCRGTTLPWRKDDPLHPCGGWSGWGVRGDFAGARGSVVAGRGTRSRLAALAPAPKTYDGVPRSRNAADAAAPSLLIAAQTK